MGRKVKATSTPGRGSWVLREELARLKWGERGDYAREKEDRRLKGAENTQRTSAALYSWSGGGL
jgi:hypothetical protein